MASLFLTAAGAAHEAVEHATPTALGFSPGAWVALAMLAVFALMLYLKVPALIASMLDKKIEGIRTQLDEAAKLRAEAEALKAEYQKKVSGAAKEAEALKAAADEEAKLIVAKAKTDATALIERRTKSAEDKIAAAERAAVAEVRAKAASAATAAASALIAQHHDTKADATLIEATIAKLN